MKALSQEFRETDKAYKDCLIESAAIDALDLREDGILQAIHENNAKDNPTDMSHVLTVASQRVIQLCEQPGSLSAVVAGHRDFDKVIGAFVAHKLDPLAEVPLAESAIDALMDSGAVSARPTFYEYLYASDISRQSVEHTYTGDVRELAFISVGRDMTDASHVALGAVMAARETLEVGDSANAEAALLQAKDATEEIRKQLTAVYADVSPSFIATSLTRYMTGIKYGGRMYEGPNASHSGFMLLDRLVFGSFSQLAQNKAMEEQLSYRLSDMPLHLQNTMRKICAGNNDEPLHELTGKHDRDLNELAVDIGQNIRKFKVAHKSFADKGLLAKGKRLNREEPDLLSNVISFARKNEGVKP